jgi:hypothetical protein
VRRTTLLILVLLVGGLLAGPAAADPRGHAHGTHDPGLGAQLAEVRAATARYHDVDVAEADDYVETPCVEHDDLGAMGHHFVNFSLLAHIEETGELDPTAPPILLYVPDTNDELQLAGVEYVSFDTDTPEILGQELKPGGPFPYALHVWVWQNNPAGMFADFNPRLSC